MDRNKTTITKDQHTHYIWMNAVASILLGSKMDGFEAVQFALITDL